ncbi:hypothetical protein PBCVNY2B_790R [Paramecium bursaria Chlorella virus NY2B]|uniref:Uncharacterized protein n=1 Tax=Paramecium bursaria Chlorella virus NYs1 TaxID=83442 RepID=M1IK40_9PHYC|nr:hypothetical protein FK949_gp240 [Paramecium bursaria Chlorella virus NYs1]AGE54387.1 hypothetical protein PBCVIL52s1_809R [Paramecium bursaria Chlorella virus IL-5-2s1]AGE58505.1 hypothetical protein PBCVNY2B_790R [Paramecium bursaria Chlorella virus NY2B]AGE58885.1 hypothetical protein PBCVNYs1_797R [Paramecium bursaria Chlorella virus NYs1]
MMNTKTENNNSSEMTYGNKYPPCTMIGDISRTRLPYPPQF